MTEHRNELKKLAKELQTSLIRAGSVGEYDLCREIASWCQHLKDRLEVQEVAAMNDIHDGGEGNDAQFSNDNA